MRKIVVASKNPVKLEAVRQGFEKMFPEERFELLGISVPSDVSDQPFDDKETLAGARNRADNASKAVKAADFYVGIEGGVQPDGDELVSVAWVVIKSAEKYGRARTGSFLLPREVARLMREGKELGEADDIVFKRNNSKQDNGAVGILTGNATDRTKYYGEAVLLALIPFRNSGLY
jgi:inosine/xanthosine triphosphatase